MNDRAIAVNGSQRPRQWTLLALVQALMRQGRTEREIEIEVLTSLESGRVELIGSFRTAPLRPSRLYSRGAGRGAPATPGQPKRAERERRPGT